MEETSTNSNQNYFPKSKEMNFPVEDRSTNSSFNSTLLPSHNASLSSSLNCLCLRLRRHQLLQEYDEKLARSSDENDFEWWKTAERLRKIC